MLHEMVVLRRGDVRAEDGSGVVADLENWTQVDLCRGRVAGPRSGRVAPSPRSGKIWSISNPVNTISLIRCIVLIPDC
jgi:hypothetical protein